MPSVKVSTHIEIAALPETVRSVFLNFSQYEQWHPVWQLSARNDKQPVDLMPGDPMTVVLGGTKFNPPVVENTTEGFAWCGDLYGLFTGTHNFRFKPSQTNPGGTTLEQFEDFSGPLAFFMKPGWRPRRQTEENFEVFNQNIKAEAERVARLG